MIRGLVIREAEEGDRNAIRELLDAAFGGDAESRLVERLRADGDRLLELVATYESELVGELFFSRLKVIGEGEEFDALALAPLAVLPARQRTGIGRALIEHAHPVLRAKGERLSVVLGDPAYYGRFDYDHQRAAGFESKYQSAYLQALAWGDAPTSGRLCYPAAFEGL
jgi:putative acetyltransferase